MRLVKRNIDSHGSGEVGLIPEEPEDMWHAYNLIRPGDYLKAPAVRRVTKDLANGATSSNRVHVVLTIWVRSLSFDGQAGQLHVAGQVAEDTDVASKGQHHTLDLELNRKFTLTKDGEYGGWDSVALAQLQEAIDPNKGTNAVAVVMQEGIAHICFVTDHQTVLKQRVDVAVPKKRSGAAHAQSYDKGLQRFYKTVLDTLLRQLESLIEGRGEQAETFPVLLASPGFVADGMLKYIREVASAQGSKLLSNMLKNNSIITVHSSSGYLNSLNEVLNSSEVRSRLKNTKFANETDLMDKFFTLLRKDDGRAWYGPKEVERAVYEGAVGRGGGVLFISNDLFRADNVDTRRRWVKLVEQVRDIDGGDVRVLSGEHESGIRLNGLGGIAAILTYPIEDLDEGKDEDQEEGSNDDS